MSLDMHHIPRNRRHSTLDTRHSTCHMMACHKRRYVSMRTLCPSPSTNKSVDSGVCVYLTVAHVREVRAKRTVTPRTHVRASDPSSGSSCMSECLQCNADLLASALVSSNLLYNSWSRGRCPPPPPPPPLPPPRPPAPPPPPLPLAATSEGGPGWLG